MGSWFAFDSHLRGKLKGHTLWLCGCDMSSIHKQKKYKGLSDLWQRQCDGEERACTRDRVATVATQSSGQWCQSPVEAGLGKRYSSSSKTFTNAVMKSASSSKLFTFSTCCFFLRSLWERLFLVPAYPKTQCLAKDDLELLIHLPLPVDWVMCHHTHFRSHWGQNPELISCSRQASYQRCHTGTPSFILSAMNFSPPVETGPTSIVTLYIFHTRVWSEKGSASLVIWKFWGNYFFNISTFGSHSSKTLERTTFVPHRQPMSCHWWLFA